jgi:glutamate carboxypeptidase
MVMKYLLSLLALSVFQISIAVAQGLSKTEKKVVDHIQSTTSEAIDLLKESTNINSGSLNIDGVKKVGAIYARELEKAGFTCTWVSMPDSIRRAGHLVAERKGKNFFSLGILILSLNLICLLRLLL